MASALTDAWQQALALPLYFSIPVALVSIYVVWAVVERLLRPADAPPVLSIGLPLIGNFLAFASDPVGTVRRGYDELGPVFTLPIFGKAMTFTLGQEHHAPFFTAKDEDLSQAEVYKFMTPVFGKGVVYDAPPAMMRQQLRFMSGSLSSINLKSYVPKIIKETEAYFAKWEDSGSVNLLDAMSELIILTASSCLMGQEIREHLFEQVAELYHRLDEGITPLSFFAPNAPIPKHLARNQARKDMVALFTTVISQRREKAKDPSWDRPKDVLQVIMDAEYKGGKTLNDQEVTGLMIALLFAGQHTSSITSTWTTLLTVHHPEVLARVMKEQEEVVGGPGAPLDYDRVNRMDELHRCMKEAVRMYPPLIFLMRHVQTPTKSGAFTIPAGHTIVASPPVSHRLPKEHCPFERPDAFEPERFAAPRSEDKVGKFGYIGFGGGLHACMGERFGFLQVKTILSVLLRTFEIEAECKDLPLPDYKAMVVGPMSKMTRVRFKRRVPAAGAGAAAAAE